MFGEFVGYVVVVVGFVVGFVEFVVGFGFG